MASLWRAAESNFSLRGVLECMRSSCGAHPTATAIAVLFAAIIIAPAPRGMAAAERPNVLVILTDDQGWGDLSLNGNTNLRTPRVDSLARDGASFDRFYVCPVCSPTRAEFLTGRYHPRTGVFNVSTGGERLDADETTVADVFRDAGYATAAFGKWHNGTQHPYHPNARGFQEFYGFCSGHWGNYFDPMLDHNGRVAKGDGYATDDFTNRAIRFIEQSSDQPFFVYLALNTPHSPMQVPDQWWDQLAERPLDLRGTEEAQEEVEHTRAALAMCENIDWNVGRLLDALERLSVADNTIVAYFCDNGPNGHRWNGGMKGIKGSTDEGGVRSPLLIRWPGRIEAGRQVGEISGAIDLLPTLAELAALETADGKPLDGVSMMRFLTDDEPQVALAQDAAESSNRILFSHWNGKVSARSSHFRWDHQGRLYDIARDPGQSVDLSSERPELAQTFRQRVDAWRESVLSELDRRDRPFDVGYGGVELTQLPARDGKPHGGVIRSSRHPNCSFFTEWKSVEDAITWDIQVHEAGQYEATLYYTCGADDAGSTIELSLGESRIVGRVADVHDPPLLGAENDRVPRTESYVKEFAPLTLGAIDLPLGGGVLTLKALDVAGDQVMDLRLLMLRRIAASN